MRPARHSNSSAADTTAWLLGSIIVVLAVVDLIVWATLWNVPNPASKFLLQPAAAERHTGMAVALRRSDARLHPALLAGEIAQPPRTPRAQ
jgi:hypothetical protein